MRQLLLDSHFLFRRTALVNQGRLEALAIESKVEEPMEGALFLGRITTVSSALEAAFVDVGFEQDAFLPLKDLPERMSAKGIKSGTELLVQLKSEAGRHKGPKVTGKIELQGRYLILMPESSQQSISRKLRDPKTKKILMDCLEGVLGSFGYMVRTEGTGAELNQVLDEARWLKARWEELSRAYVTAVPPKCLDPGLSLSQRLLVRHLADPDTALMLANPDDAPVLDAFLAPFGLSATERIKAQERSMYTRPGMGQKSKRQPNLFDSFGLEGQIKALLEPKVDFGGAYLILEPTEAFLAVDVNAGAAAAGVRQSDAVKTRINQQAIVECLRQMELRNIGGMVLMDLIDAEGAKAKKTYEGFLSQTLKASFSNVFAGEVNDFGILSMTRRRMGRSLADRMTVCCRCCGKGWVLSPLVQMDDMLREVVREGGYSPRYLVSPLLAEALMKHQTLLKEAEAAFHFKLQWSVAKEMEFFQTQYKKTL